MGFGYMLAGFLFLVNPVIHVIDILPDCIGFWLIARGLTKSAFFVNKLELAKNNFTKLAVLDLIKLFSLLIWPFVSDTAMLLLAFVFSVLELMLFIPAMINLLEGFSFAGVWYKGSAVYASIPRRIFKFKKQQTENGGYEKVPLPPRERGIFWRNFTIVFYCIRVFFTVLPEVLGQMLYDRYVVYAMSVNYAEYKPVMYILLGFILILLGIFWLISTIMYLGGIVKDKVFIDNLKRKFKDDILPNKNLFTSIDMKRVLILFALAAATSVICSFDGVNLMIGAVSSVCVILAAVILRKQTKAVLIAVPVSLVRIVMSVITLLKQIEYFNDYTIDSVDWVSNAFKMYYSMAYISAAEYIIAIAPMLILTVCMVRAFRTHLDWIGVQTESVQYSKKARNAEIFKALRFRAGVNLCLMVINYLVSAMYPFSRIYMDVMSFIVIAVTLIWLIQTLFWIHAVNEQIYDRLAENY
ncbi:MAG: hypothetical protein E7658_03025 [Ruminococcaceae bacterium]|nr:hypothetical protein [Oscillospiraceae bacterium]